MGCRFRSITGLDTDADAMRLLSEWSKQTVNSHDRIDSTRRMQYGSMSWPCQQSIVKSAARGGRETRANLDSNLEDPSGS
jgi:hypothetical protein